MKKLLAIGEALIDFIPSETGTELKAVSAFQPKTGGAPANVCGAYGRLGGKGALITQLGADPFGDKIIEELTECGIDVSYVKRTEKANTSLAFVALTPDGGREFSFYRKPGADMLLAAEDIREEWFEDAFALHYCSVDLVECPMKEAHRRAIEIAADKNMIVSFDPNLRFALWESEEALRATVQEFMPMAHILKISDEELEFLTGEKKIEKALPRLLCGRTKMVVYTGGSDGASCFTAHAQASARGVKVHAIDTTGAGDGFIGSFLYSLSHDGITADTLDQVSAEKMKEYLTFSNKFCGISVTRNGAIASYPTMEEMHERILEDKTAER